MAEDADLKKEYENLVRSYQALLGDISAFEKKATGVHQEILSAIDQEKMESILQKIKEIKQWLLLQCASGRIIKITYAGN